MEPARLAASPRIAIPPSRLQRLRSVRYQVRNMARWIWLRLSLDVSLKQVYASHVTQETEKLFDGCTPIGGMACGLYDTKAVLYA